MMERWQTLWTGYMSDSQNYVLSTAGIQAYPFLIPEEVWVCCRIRFGVLTAVRPCATLSKQLKNLMGE
jgi:hypothetical protein